MDWGKVLGRYAEGANPEMFARARAQKEEMVNNEQRRQLLQSQESRAQAAEGRESDSFEFQKSQRPLLAQKLQIEVDAGRLSNQQAKNLLDSFDAAGGAAGAGSRVINAENRAANEDKRAAARLGIDQAQLGLQKTAADLARRKGEQDLAFEAETNPSRKAILESQADPRMRYESMIQALASAMRAPGISEEQAAALGEKIIELQARGEAEAQAWMSRRGVKPTSTPQSQPQKGEKAFFGVPDEIMRLLF